MRKATSLAEFNAYERQIRREVRLVECHMDASTGQRWLKPLQFAVLFGLSLRTVYGMVRRGQLVSVRLGRQLRIADPGWFYQDLQADPAETVPILYSCEVAVLLGIKPQSVRKLARRHRIGYQTIRGKRIYSLGDVRRLMAARGLRHRRLRPGQSVHQGMVSWTRGRLPLQGESMVKFGLQGAAKGGTLPSKPPDPVRHA
ncbi:MAG: helix-turn-helix domain-containing protein [Acidobacteria bacterium]|nr:helix-turn-helix domain-containing protein [Acidobacteriota bacterium]